MMRNYTLTLRTEGPVFVGDGGKIGKKEYIYMRGERRVYIPDMVKMYRFFEEKKLSGAYEDYLLYDRRDFAAWLRDQKLCSPRQFLRWTAYFVDSADAVVEERGKREILTFQKDAYGCPFVPGSSAKGMLRTVLLGAWTARDGAKLDETRRAVRQADLRVGRTRLLKRETGQIEETLLHTLRRNEKRPADAVNDMLSGLRVGDSRPLSTDDLILCQKIDVTTDGERRPLPIFRECLRPGVEISFDLTLEPEYFPYPADELTQAAERFRETYQQCFRGAFPTNAVRGGGTVYLGGGCGYATKTVAYPLLGKSGLERVSQVIDATLPPQARSQHRHSLDKRKGASPHMLKCTQYRGQLYEMGACSIEIQEKP